LRRADPPSKESCLLFKFKKLLRSKWEQQEEEEEEEEEEKKKKKKNLDS
jgi:hypothetical protein